MIIRFGKGELRVRLVKELHTAWIVIRNLILGGNIASLSLLTKPKSMINYISESLFLYKTLNSKRGITQKNVFEVLKSSNTELLKLGSLTNGGTWFWRSSYTTDIINLCLICQLLKPKVIFEIGTFNGYTAFHFALNSAEDAVIYTLDLQKQNNFNPKLKTTAFDDMHIRSYLSSNKLLFTDDGVASKIHCLFGDSAEFDFSPYHDKVDFFFIDGAHSYEYVRSDTLNALNCCHSGSVIAWHDFGRVGLNGVSKWILELSKKYDIYSVPDGSLAFMVVK